MHHAPPSGPGAITPRLVPLSWQTSRFIPGSGAGLPPFIKPGEEHPMKTLGTIKLTLCLLAVLMLTTRVQAAGLALSGEVQSSHQAIAGSQVRLLEGAPGKATLLAERQTAPGALFSFTVHPPPGPILSLIASGGRPRAGAGAANSA